MNINNKIDDLDSGEVSRVFKELLKEYINRLMELCPKEILI